MEIKRQVDEDLKNSLIIQNCIDIVNMYQSEVPCNIICELLKEENYWDVNIPNITKV